MGNLSIDTINNRDIDGELDSFVKKESGKGLSTVDFTPADKEMISLKVDKEVGKGLSTLDFTENDKITIKNKVDKVDGKGLSKNDFTDECLSQLAATASHFKGIYLTEKEIFDLQGCIKKDYAILKGDTDIVYFYDGIKWINSGKSLGGDMISTFYDPHGVREDVYNRIYHKGMQEISTITGLQDLIDSKLDAKDKINVIDNYDSTSSIDALSAKAGSRIHSQILSMLSGPIDYGSSLNINGYAKLSSGIILQWGNKDMGVGHDNETLQVQYNIPYPNNAFIVVACPIANTTSGSGSDSAYAQVIDNTKFYLCKDYKALSVATNVAWISVGY